MDCYWRIPLDEHGGVIRIVKSPSLVKEWVPKDTTWTKELQLKSAQQHSSVWFDFWNVKNSKQIFPFNLAFFVDMVRKCAIVNGKVLGKFGVQKRGLTYSMCYIGVGDWNAKM